MTNSVSENINTPVGGELKIETTAIRAFCDYRLSKDMLSYDEIMERGHGNIKFATSTEFQNFLNRNSAYSSLLGKADFLKNIDRSKVIQNTLLQRRTEFELLQNQVLKLIGEEFNFGNESEMKRKLEILKWKFLDPSNINIRIPNLKSMINSPEKREAFLRKIYGQGIPSRKAIISAFKKLHLEDSNFTDVQRNIILGFHRTYRQDMGAQEIRTLFDTLWGTWANIDHETRKQLVSALMRNTTIQDLVDLDILDKADIKRLFLTQVEESYFYSEITGKSNSSSKNPARDAKTEYMKAIEEAYDQKNVLDLSYLYVDVRRLDDASLNKIFEHEMLAQRMQDVIQESVEELLVLTGDNEQLDLLPDHNGELLTAFFVKLKKEMGTKIQDLNRLENKLKDQIANPLEPSAAVYLQGEFEEPATDDKPASRKQSVIAIHEWIAAWTDSKIRIGVPAAYGMTVEDISLVNFWNIADACISGKIVDEAAYAESRRKEASSDSLNSLDFNESLINTTEELLGRIDACDPDGASMKLDPGVTFCVGKKGETSFNIAQIIRVDEANKQILVRNTLGVSEIVSFLQVARMFENESLSAKRFKTKLNHPDQLIALESELFKDIEWDSERRMYVNSKRKSEKKEDYEGIRTFVNGDGEGFELDDVMEDGTVRLRTFEGYKSVDVGKGSAASVKAASGWVTRPLHTVLYLINTMKVKSVDSPKNIKAERFNELDYTTQGYGKRIFRLAGIADVVSGVAQLPKFVKKKLEQGSHFHSAEIALHVASSIPGVPKEWLAEFRDEVNNGNKKKVGELKETLNGFPSPKRHEQVLAYLNNAGTHEYELVAGIISLLEKHGNLYPGGALSPLEGTWSFFRHKAIPGSIAEKEAFLDKQRRESPDHEYTEPEIIFIWLLNCQKVGRVNPFYWQMIKKAWKEGAIAEMESGGKESDSKVTMNERVNYAFDKFKGGEYAHSIGAMEKSWNLHGDLSERMRMPFVMLMSDTNLRVHPDIAQKFEKLYSSGHIYPPLLFMESKQNRELFLAVVKKLLENNSTGLTALNDALSAAPDKRAEALSNFWGKYGRSLYKKLAVTSEEPEIFLKKDKVGIYGEYYKILHAAIDDNTPMDGEELNNGTYEPNAMGWAMLHMKRFVSKIEIIGGPATLGGGKDASIIKYHFDTLQKHLENIRSFVDPNMTLTENLTAQKNMYAEVHRNFMKHIHASVSDNKWKLDGEGEPEVVGSAVFSPFKNYGFSIPQGPVLDSKSGKTVIRKYNQADGEAVLKDDARYQAWLDEDFNRFMGGASANRVTQQVHVNFSNVMNHRRAASNPPAQTTI